MAIGEGWRAVAVADEKAAWMVVVLRRLRSTGNLAFGEPHNESEDDQVVRDKACNSATSTSTDPS